MDFDVTEGDVTIQLDVFDDMIEFWAWPSDESMPLAPTVSSEGVGVPEGWVFLWTSNEFAPQVGSGLFRYVQLATQPIPEPSSGVLGLLGLLGLMRLRRRNN